MDNCIFCKIISGAIKADVVYQDEQVFAFRDISPQAPAHILVIPKEHAESLPGLKALKQIWEVIPQIAQEQKLSGGYRVVLNQGKDAGQLVPHVHFHILGGRLFHWPPG